LDLDAVWGGEPWSVVGWVYQMGIEIVEGEGVVLEVNMEHPIATNGDFVA